MRILFPTPVVFLLTILISLSNATIRKVPQEYAKIQLAVNAAVNGDTVLVAEGTYTENLFIDKKIFFCSYYALDWDTSHISRTIVDGSGSTNPDSSSVITLGSSTDISLVIKGFTIRGGKGNITVYPSVPNAVVGGGIQSAVGGTASITKNIIENNNLVPTVNASDSYGGGIALWKYPPYSKKTLIIDSNIIRNNTVSGINTDGAGLEVDDMRIFIRANIIENNSSNGTTWSGGGALYTFCPNGDTLFLQGNIIRGNMSIKDGGALYVSGDQTALSPTVIFENNIIHNNTALRYGGAVFANAKSKVILVNNTIVNNSAVSGSAVYITSNTLALGLNNIFSNNNAGTQLSASNSTLALDFNLINGQTIGINSINADPGFINNDNLYRLSTNSPAIGAGTMSSLITSVKLNAPKFDFLNTPRPRTAGTQPDLGAIEHDLPSAVGSADGFSNIPSFFELEQNYPNPFNPSTTFRYALPTFAHVRLTVYDMLGREVETLINEEQSAGWKEVEWTAGTLSSGIYFYTIQAGAFSETKKLMLLK